MDTKTNKILGVYKIIYANGMVQFCNLISHSDYESIIIPTKEKISELSLKKEGLAEAKELKRYLKAQFSDNYFTDKSAMFNAIETGILSLPEHQGGDHKCTVVEVVNTGNVEFEEEV